MNKNYAIALLLTAMALHCAGPNAKPQAPTDVNWPVSVQPGEEATLAVVLLDGDGDSIACRFDWGNGDTSEWSANVASGQTLTTTHAWTQLGLYDVRMQARDRRGAVSDWSSQREITVGDVHPVLWSMAARTSNEGGFASPVVASTPLGEMIFSGELHSLWRLDSRGVARGMGVSLDSSDYGGFVGQPAWSPTGGHLLVGSDEGELYAVGPGMDIIWHWPGNWNGYMFDGCPWGTAAVDGEMAYVMREEDYFVLYALRDLGDRGLATASLVPGDPEGDEVYGPPVVDREGNVYVVTEMGYVSKYSAGLERLEWSVMNDYDELTGAVIDNAGRVLVVSPYGLSAVSSTGSIEWSQSMDEPSLPVVGDSLVFVGDADGRVWALRSESGNDVWYTDVGGSFVSSPLIAAGGRLYCCDMGGSLFCLSTDSGRVLWRTDLRIQSGSRPGRYPWDLPASMTVTSAGDIIVADEYGIYCIRGYPDGQLANAPWPKWQHDVYNTGCARTPIP